MGEYVPRPGQGAGDLPGMGGVYNTINFHVYHYAGNNPIKLIDPDGRIFDIDDNGDPSYKTQVEEDIDRIEQALRESGDEYALQKFLELKTDPNYIVTITKIDPKTGQPTNKNGYLSEDLKEFKNSDGSLPDFPNDVERFAVGFENAVRWGYNKDPSFQWPRYYPKWAYEK
jgi:hypothetical protein